MYGCDHRVPRYRPLGRSDEDSRKILHWRTERGEFATVDVRIKEVTWHVSVISGLQFRLSVINPFKAVENRLVISPNFTLLYTVLKILEHHRKALFIQTLSAEWSHLRTQVCLLFYIIIRTSNFELRLSVLIFLDDLNLKTFLRCS